MVFGISASLQFLFPLGLPFHFVGILPGVKKISDINMFSGNPVDDFLMAYN